MDYELALELKKAGFPQNEAQYYYGQGFSLHNDAGSTTVYDLFHRDSKQPVRPWIEYIAAPTLSELIEACGDRFEELTRVGHGDKKPRWTATSYSCEECGWDEMINGRGSTSEEAVARLWLAIHTPKPEQP